MRLGGVVAVVAGVLFALPGAGQLLDQTIGDIVDQDVADQVEEDVAAAVEDVVQQQVESSVAQQVEQQVASTVQQTVESSVAQQVEQAIANTVEQTVESGVTGQIEQAVTGAVQQTLESEVVNAVQQQVESSVVGTIAAQVESGVAGQIGEQLLDTVQDTVQGEIGDVVNEIGNGVRDVAQGVQNAAGVDNPAAERSETFVADVDPLGRGIERETWIILVPAEHAARIATWGFTIRERQDLATLNRVLLRVAAPENRDIAQAALELALDAPGTQVDFNHVYRPGAEPAVARAATGMPAIANATPPRPAPALPALAVGVVDTAVASEHEALRNADIVQHDFVPFAAERPTAHGTAVASILVGEGGKLRPQLTGGRVYAASVFFADEDGNDASTAASITVATEWLVTQGVSVINMSLAGPPNRVLEATIAALTERGAIVVAAVGNNGPNGAPLYPAAYANVVGVTAIDSAHRIYRYANRGPHVVFAAPGVGIPAARSGGGYREQTGTSIAAPHVAAVIARMCSTRVGAPAAEIVVDLKSHAVDLGAKDFDNTFGFGLITPLETGPITASR